MSDPTPKVERQSNGEVWVDIPLAGCPSALAEFVVEPFGEVTYWGLTTAGRHNIGNKGCIPIPIPWELQDAIRRLVPKEVAA